MLQPLLGTPEGIHRGCTIIKKQVFATNRDPWATYLQVSVAPSRVELEKNAFGSGLYIPWRGTYWVALIFFVEKVQF